MLRSSLRATALSLASLFGLVSVVYIAWSDKLVASLTSDPGQMTAIQTYKGWGYVFGATALVYALLRVAQKHRDAAEEARHTNEERIKADLSRAVAARTAELQTAEARTALILESIADGLVGLDRDGLITLVNPAATRILGHAPDALIGRPIQSTLFRTPRSEEECPIIVALHAGQSARSDRELWTCADEREIPVEYAFQPMMNDAEVIGGVLSFTDISERRAGEAARAAALSEAERLARARSEFLANMSHEIRTPLNAVIGLAQVGARGGRAEQDTFAHILRSGQHLLSIVNDVLDFSKIEAGKLSLLDTPFVLGEVIDRAIEIVAGSAFGKGVFLRVDEAVDLPEGGRGDALRLSQVLVNLLGNAIKFTERGGRVSLSVTAGPDLVFQVADTGIGMNAEHVARLFRPFEQADGSTTRRWGGTGLGLSISKHLVDMMGGSIDVESRPGEGSVFRVHMPLTGATWPELRDERKHVAIPSLANEDVAQLAEALGARGFTVDAEASALLVSAEALGEDGIRRAVEAHVEAGLGALVIATPGAGQIPAALRGRVHVIERPVRARHVIDVIRGRASKEAVPRSDEPRLRGISILAAEDNEANRVVLEAMLTREGATLLCVEHGREAISTLEKRGENAFDILLTDIQMPVMDGYETARHVRAMAPTLPILGVTAHAMPEERARCLEAGMVERLIKPLHLESLVTSVLRHARARSAPLVAARAESAIDWADLEECFSDNPLVVGRLVATALRTHGEDAAKLLALAATGDLVGLAAAAHSVKGMSGNLRATRVFALAKEVEDAARAKDLRALEIAPRLAAAVTEMMEELSARAKAT